MEPPSLFHALPELDMLRRAYPDVVFEETFDDALDDWKITVVSEGRTSVLYRADGRYLTAEQLAAEERYRQLIYMFPEKLADPSDFSPEQIERISLFGSSGSRSAAPVSSAAFFDAVYDSATEEAIEKHIVSVSFFDKRIRVHERIVSRLAAAEAKTRALAETRADVAEFIRTLESANGYSWRQIRDTSGRSFHSMGLAVDMLPRNWQRKTIYWFWERNKGNDRWMLIPLSDRWMPPESVIEAFESEGFIWGGKWSIWDNMHFEYRPELILARTVYSWD